MIDEIKNLDKKYYMNTFGERLPVAFCEGEGMVLESTEGEKYRSPEDGGGSKRPGGKTFAYLKPLLHRKSGKTCRKNRRALIG